MTPEASPSSNSPLYPQGNPNPDRLRFATFGVIDAEVADFTEAVNRVAEMLGRPVHFTDEKGYEQDIIAAAVDLTSARWGWIESRSKELDNYVDVEFRLKAREGERQMVDWVVETYNPYFGCRVGYMHWLGEHLVLIYREKHHTYACSFPSSGPMVRIQIDDEWVLSTDRIGFMSNQEGRIERLTLPGLEKLESITSEEARSQGLLPKRFDEVAASRSMARERWRERMRQIGKAVSD